MPPPRRRHRAYFIVYGLGVPAPWRVGPAVFRPAAWMRRLIDDRGRPWSKRALTDTPSTSVVEVPISALHDDAIAALPELQEVARDAVAILRLFQRSHFGMNVELQAFGMADDRGTFESWAWVADRDAIRHSMVGRTGQIAAFSFRPEDRRAYYADRRFQYLGNALETADADRTDWQRRLVRGLRAVHVAQPTARPSSKVVAYATGLEAVFGDDPRPAAKGPRSGEGVRMAQRAAYLTCVGDGIPRHGPERPACMYLAATDAKDLDRRIRGRIKSRQPWRCSAYADVRGLYLDRNAALHDAEDRFDLTEVRRLLGVIDGAILAAVSWVVERESRRFADLDDEIGTLVAEASP